MWLRFLGAQHSSITPWQSCCAPRNSPSAVAFVIRVSVLQFYANTLEIFRNMKLAIITDTHISQDGAALLANLEAVRAWVDSLKPDATVHLGDVSAEGAVHPQQLQTAAALFADWPSPLYVLPGNHDVGENEDSARPG